MEGLTRAAALALGVLVALAAEAAGDVSWYTQIDNDVAVHTDRWYTSGLRIARTNRLAENEYAEFGVLQEIYTPDVHRLDPTDRPYAGRLLVTAARHDFMPGLYRTLELDVGVRGPAALGRQSTEFVHRFIPAAGFDWSRQLPNRVDAQAIAVQTHEFALPAAEHARWALHYGAVLGNTVTFAHAGVEVRTGGPQAIAGPALRFAATPPLAAAGAQGWSAFAGVSGRWVAHNSLLSRNAIEFGPPIERIGGVARGAAGVAWSAPWGAVTFTAVADSPEFETQHTPHGFGILGLRVDFP